MEDVASLTALDDGKNGAELSTAFASDGAVAPKSATVGAGKRPSRYSSEVRRAAAMDLAAQIVTDWNPEDEQTAEEWVEEIVRHADWCGYKFARNLESYCGVYPDAALVEILESWATYEGSAHKAAVKAWLALNPQTPLFAIGDEVVAEVGRRMEVGKIISIYPETAEYIVQTKDTPTGGYVVPYEAVTPSRPSATEDHQERTAPTQDTSREDSSGLSRPPTSGAP